MDMIHLDFQISSDKTLRPGAFSTHHRGVGGEVSRHHLESHRTSKTRPHNRRVCNNVKSKFQRGCGCHKAQQKNGHQRQVEVTFSHHLLSQVQSLSDLLPLKGGELTGPSLRKCQRFHLRQLRLAEDGARRLHPLHPLTSLLSFPLCALYPLKARRLEKHPDYFAHCQEENITNTYIHRHMCV